MTTKQLTTLLNLTLKNEGFTKDLIETGVVISSRLKHIDNFTVSVHENTMGLVTHINLDFADIQRKVTDYMCNIYPHEFDTIDNLKIIIKEQEHKANKDLKHRNWVFRQLQRQTTLEFPTNIPQHACGKDVRKVSKS